MVAVSFWDLVFSSVLYNARVKYKLICVGCSKIVSEKKSVTRCPSCGEALDVVSDFAALKQRVAKDFDRTAPLSGRKYAAFYPLKNPRKVVSLGEGGTPLIQLKKIGRQLKLKNLYVKNEGQNPTGVFKDRGSLVEVTKAKELNAKAIVCASTGNMAASVSAYAALCGLPCYVLIPEGTPLGKLAQTLSYGARVLQIRGTYGDCCRLSEEMAAKYRYYLAGDYAFRGEGQKSLAFEVCEQLGWVAPDVVIVPVGCGTNLAAIWQGFVEFKQLGFIKNLPRMIAVQPEGCSTIVAAFQKHKKQAPIVKQPQTVCSAVGIGTPLDDVKALRSLRQSHGTAVAVSDTVVVAANRSLGAEEAIFVEPSGALPLAAVVQLQKSKQIQPTDTVVLVATGAGLKDPKNALRAHPTPPSVEPISSEIDRFLKYKLYAIRASGYLEKERQLFTKVPTAARLVVVIKKEFNASLKKTHLAEVRAAIGAFLAKGKSVGKADLQHLLEDALTDLTYETRILDVLDYDLQVTKTKPPEATVWLRFAGRKCHAKAQGVGPVDAVLNALRTAIKNQDKLNIRLTDYSVRIDDKGTAATTEVKMRLHDKQGQSVIASATSPDIITASIEAFVKGYNILYWKQQSK